MKSAASTLHTKFRDKAPRPSAFISQPSGQLTCSTPELRAQLNLTNDHKKKESPYLQECPDASTWSHVMLKIVELRTLLGKVGKGLLSQLQAMQWPSCESGESQVQRGSCLTLTRPTCETLKKGQLFHFT